MVTSRDLPADRLAVGQLLVRLLRQFRAELFEPAAEHGYPDLREPHLHIFGNLGVDGIRLTDLAARAQLSLATASELVSHLQDLGYLERRADGTDKRAKLIFPTPRGRQALDDAGDRVAQIEEHWSQIVGPERFAGTCRTLQELLDALTGSIDRSVTQQLPPRPSREAPLLHDQLKTDSGLTRSGESQQCDRTS
jgi:DNA-binding MarR family transcriptional regulator